jgi:hypothetical protein
MSAQLSPSSTYSCSFAIESWIYVSLKPVVTEQVETYPDHCQEDADGAKRGLGWWDINDVLRKIQGVDGHLQ